MLAQRATVLCGDKYVDWSVMKYCRLKADLNFIFNVEVTAQTLGAHGTIRHITTSSDFNAELFDGIDTFTTLITARSAAGQEARCPKDYVYGYLGLLGVRMWPRIEVDYGLPDSQVFKEAVALGLRGSEADRYEPLDWQETLSLRICACHLGFKIWY